jgi:hypothetical protein
MISICTEVPIYEIDGDENNDSEKILKIHNHWNDVNRIDVEFPGFDRITVLAKDMKAAIENAINTV